MLTKVNSCAVVGLDGVLIEVEVDRGDGQPGVVIVGLPDTAVQEGREREKFLIDGERIDVLTYGRLHFDPGAAASAMRFRAR